MILLVSENGTVEARVRRVVGGDLLRIADAVPPTDDGCPIHAAIVPICGQRHRRGIDHLHELCRHHPEVLRIAIIAMNRLDIRAAVRAQVCDVVFEDTLEVDLRIALVKICSAHVLTKSTCPAAARRKLGHIIGSDLALSPFVRHVIEKALLPHPPRRVGDLVEATHRPRSTVQYHWRNEITMRGGPTLHGFLQWLLLLHATEASKPGKSYSAVAAELQVEPNVLRSVFRRLMNSRADVGSDSTDVAKRLHAALYRRTGPQEQL